MAKRVPIGTFDEFEAGRIHGLQVDGRQLILVNLEGTLHVLDGICTHAFAELAMGFLTGEEVRCPLHLSQFDVETGEAVSPPAEEALRTYPVEVEGDAVYVVLD
ncbi:MAG: non-heme iron oxygenase ferredoxin subunit [Candidatus Thermoplasmatota archaeon]|nr:non-heme iron oxygenase ferredoxin subunit [Candidatus Thermoplasmatota archaeon]